MAAKRMFSLEVVDTDKFLDMPTSTQNLYFHLGMRADDDGFVSSPKKIASLAGCGQDDLKLLATKGYIIPFETGVIVITHWKQHNTIRSERRHATAYQNELSRLCVSGKEYCLSDKCLPNVRQMSDGCLPNVSIGLDLGLDLDLDTVIDSSESITPQSGEKKAAEKRTGEAASGILLPLIDGTAYDVPAGKIAKWSAAYPAVDVKQELKKMSAWLDANPKRRKTARGVDRFINTWLSREQDRGGVYRNAARQQNAPDSEGYRQSVEKTNEDVRRWAGNGSADGPF